MGLPDPQSMAIIQDYEQVRAIKEMLRRVSRTLEILFTYHMDEQSALPFKMGLKLAVRRAVTCGVGYVKLSFQRAMKRDPSVERQIADYEQQLSRLQQLAEDMADQVIDENSRQAEELKLILQD